MTAEVISVFLLLICLSTYVAGELVGVEVLFRHGARIPMEKESYPNDPYKDYNYSPLKHSALTNLGKKQEYDLGVWLRERYSSLLGSVYSPDILKVQTTDVSRTKMSALALLSGLWPPQSQQQFIQNFIWQPIPYDYTPTKQDFLITAPSIRCKAYKKKYKDILNSKMAKKNQETYADLIEYIKNSTGLKSIEPKNALELFSGLDAIEKYGLQLPEWTNEVFPNPMGEYATLHYRYQTHEKKMKRATSGYLLDKIISDFKEKLKNNDTTKMHLYSAHETNLGQMLCNLDIFDDQVPPFASAIIWEFHQTPETNGIMMYYQNYKTAEPHLLTLPGCDSLCPVDEFKNLLSYFLDEKDDMCD